eukprot:10477077-Alexandrium_andersonii.AAC.1
MGERALAGQLGAYVNASSPIARHPSGVGPERALRGLCGGALAPLWGVSAIGRWPVLRLAPNCYDLADILVL